MKKAILLPMLCLITLCGCEKSTELSEITGNTGNSENPETETPENGSLTFQLHTDKTTCNLLDLTVFQFRSIVPFPCWTYPISLIQLRG